MISKKSCSLFFNKVQIVILISLMIFILAAKLPIFAQEKPGKIVVGGLHALTGPFAVYGEPARTSMEIAIEHVNESGGIQSLGGIPLELVFEDVGEDVMTSRLAAESLINKHKPVAVLGSMVSRFSTAISEITDREKVIYVSDALVDSLTEMGRQYLFRPGPKASIHGEVAVEYVLDMANKRGIPVENIAILNEDSSFGRSVAIGAVRASLNNNLTTVYQKEYPYDLNDVSPIVEGIRASKADFLVQAVYYMDGILFAKTFKELKMIPKFIAGMGASGYFDPDTIEALGESAEYFTNTISYNPAKDTPQNHKFVNDYLSRTGGMPNEAAGMSYYGLWTLKEALELSGNLFPEDPLNPDNLRNAFLQLDLTSGPAVDTFPVNHISFNATGDNIYAEAIVMQVIDGEPRVVWPFEDAEVEFVFPRPDTTY